MSEPEREQPTHVSAASGLARSAEAADDPDAVGERVAAILRAAEDAAKQIRAEARLLSDRLLQEARESAEAKIAELTRAAEESRREADEYARDLRMAVEAYAKKHRQDAEEGARRLTDEADARAKAVIESAEEGARRIAEEAHRQQERLRAETQRLEDHRRHALNGVRKLMTTLEELLEAPHQPAPTLDETLANPRRLGRERA